MSLIQRLYDRVNGQVIDADHDDSDFDQLVNMFRGLLGTEGTFIRFIASQSTTQLTDQLMSSNGTIAVKNTSAANAGAGEDTLHQITIKGNVLNGSQSYLDVLAAGSMAANDNNKRLRFYIDANLIFDTGIFNPNTQAWFHEFKIFSDESSQKWRVVGKLVCETLELRINALVNDINHANDHILKWTAEAVNDNDVIQTNYLIKKGFGLNA